MDGLWLPGRIPKHKQTAKRSKGQGRLAPWHRRSWRHDATTDRADSNQPRASHSDRPAIPALHRWLTSGLLPGRILYLAGDLVRFQLRESPPLTKRTGVDCRHTRYKRTSITTESATPTEETSSCCRVALTPASLYSARVSFLVSNLAITQTTRKANSQNTTTRAIQHVRTRSLLVFSFSKKRRRDRPCRFFSCPARGSRVLVHALLALVSSAPYPACHVRMRTCQPPKTAQHGAHVSQPPLTPHYNM